MIDAWTDYPIPELGDPAGFPAPIRECGITEFDQDRYVTVIVGGVKTSFEAGYVYTDPGRSGQVPVVPLDELMRLPERA